MMRKLCGLGPDVVSGEMVARYLKYNAPARSFEELRTKQYSATVTAISLWPKHYPKVRRGVM